MANEHRTIDITEVDPATRTIRGRDEHGQLVALTNQFLQPIITVPQVGEKWLINRQGNQWLLDRRFDQDDKLLGLESGDVHIDAKNNLHITAPAVIVNGEELSNHTKVVTNSGEIVNAQAIRFRNGHVINDPENNLVDIWPSAKSEVGILVNGILKGSAPEINLIGSGVTFTGAYNLATNQMDITATVPPPPQVNYGTSLPASPANGDETILVDSTSAPTYQWRFRYNSSASTNKWEFIGGAPKLVEAGSSTRASSSYGAPADSGGPTFTIPRAGIYVMRFGFKVTSVPFDDVPVFMSFTNGGTASADSRSVQHVGGQRYYSVSRSIAVTVAAASDAITAQYKSNGQTATFDNRFIEITPMRIS